MDRRTFLKRAGGLSGLPLFSSLGSASTRKPNPSEHLLASQDELKQTIGPVHISVIGCGGCGVRFVSHIADHGIPNMHDGVRVDYFGIDNAGSAFGYINKAVMKHIIVMGQPCRGWPSVGRSIAKETPGWVFGSDDPDADEFWENQGLRLPRAAMVIVVAGLGRGFGTGFAQAIAHRARWTGALTVAMVTLPFAYEHQRVPLSGELWRLERATDAVFAFSHDYAPWAGPALTITDRMGKCEFEISQCVRNLIRTFAVPGLIGFDCHDIRPLIERGGVCWYGHSVGIDRGGVQPDLAAEAVIKAVSERKFYPGFVDESYCARRGYGRPNARNALIVFSGNSDTLKFEMIWQGSKEWRRLFGIGPTLLNAYVDDTMKTGRIKAEIWASGIERS